MPVIDIDSHFEPAANWLDEFPALREKLPERFPTEEAQDKELQRLHRIIERLVPWEASTDENILN